jgi:drug/metabolite transporter (DMT)-like permease
LDSFACTIQRHNGEETPAFTGVTVIPTPSQAFFDDAPFSTNSSMTAYIAALGAALCWSIGGLIAVTPVRRLGPIGFNRLRLPMVFGMLCILAAFTGGWFRLQMIDLWPVFLSSLIGIFLGDSALFYTINQLGPRRTSILFATNAPITAVISFVVFDERLTGVQLAGCSVVLAGVFLAIVFGTTAHQTHAWEKVRGSLLLGVSAGLAAAFCQAVGAIMIKPVMERGADPLTISAMRVGISAVFLLTLGWYRQRKTRVSRYEKPTRELVLWVAFSGFLGMAMGMTLLLFGLARGEAGIVTTLAATTPVMMLPLLWAKTRERPAVGSWIGAMLTVIGSAILFNH